ncbi:CHAT domain-containing protein [Reichenbachiella faecimaris]
MTGLWKVDDRTTTKLMRNFYKNGLVGEEIKTVFNQVQKAVKQ